MSDAEDEAEVKLLIGFDDTDSPRTGCTTYIAALLIEKLQKLGVHFFDYPNLIRLNPNAPWKTRGNGAICLRTICEEQLLEDVKECVVETVEEHADLSYVGTDPGVVFWAGDVPVELEDFSRRAVQGIVEMSEALRLIKACKAEAVGLKKGRGIIGGLAAVGERLKGDHTYEFIAYRTPENRGTRRRVDASSVVRMDRQMGRSSFSNVDPETHRILITPRGPDPILYGIRGETPEAVRRAYELVLSSEPIERWVIYRTNQGTDAHLKRAVSIGEVKPHNPVAIAGEVSADPQVIKGGHVIFQIEDRTGKIDCAAYEPTGRLRDTARLLIAGDSVEVCGGVRQPSSGNPITVNLEKISIIKMAPSLVSRNPLCPVCGKRTKSVGKGQGFECRRCGFHGSNLRKIVQEVERPIKPGLYVTSPRSQRHLTKPLSRYGLEKPESSRDLEKPIPYSLFSSL